MMVMMVMMMMNIMAGAHNPERLTSILRLCNGVFTSSKCVINNKLLIRNQDNSLTLKKKHGGRT